MTSRASNIYIILHVTLQNTNIWRQISLFNQSGNKYYQREKKMSAYQKKITWCCLKTDLCVCQKVIGCNAIPVINCNAATKETETESRVKDEPAGIAPLFRLSPSFSAGLLASHSWDHSGFQLTCLCPLQNVHCPHQWDTGSTMYQTLLILGGLTHPEPKPPDLSSNTHLSLSRVWTDSYTYMLPADVFTLCNMACN